MMKKGGTPVCNCKQICSNFLFEFSWNYGMFEIDPNYIVPNVAYTAQNHTNMTRPRVFFDFSVDGTPTGRVVFELFNDFAPKTSENFRALCTGEHGISPLSQRPLYYKSSIIHRSIKNFMIQGGDFTKHNGSGGESIYGGTFADEDLGKPLDAEGLLCMANKGPNTNGSQFFITLRDCSHLNGKHVVFGRVIRGYDDVVKKLSDVPVDGKDRPTVPILISNCGELQLRNKRPSEASETKINKRAKSTVEDSPKRGKRRSKRPLTPESDQTRPNKRKSKHRGETLPSPVDGTEVVEHKSAQHPAETEEEYDSRLEREEKERLEFERKQELERVRRKYADSEMSADGVRFKGRGRMKFVDPELSQRR